jgi:hypothetical protein
VKSYQVKFWAIRPGKAKTKRTYEVRWKVGRAPHSRTLGNKAHAENFLSDLRQAARAGEPFDVATGLPASMTTARSRSWFAFCLAYMDMKWPAAAPKTRESLTDALATIIPAVTDERIPDWLEPAVLRRALRQFALAPGSRELERPPEAAAALRWLEKSSLPVTEVGKPFMRVLCSMRSASGKMAVRPGLPRSPASGGCSSTCSGMRSRWRSCPRIRWTG